MNLLPARLKTWVNIILFCAALIGIARFCHHETKGFRLSKIRDNFPLDQGDIRGEAGDYLGQKYYFLSRGLQSFVFVSQDGRYVLKLFNNSLQGRHFRYSFLRPFFDFAGKKCLDAERQLTKTFASYLLAFDKMQDKTALLYLHAAPTTTLPCALTLVDLLGIEHIINPNEIGFLIQHKVALAYPALEAFIQSKEEEKAKEAIASLVQLFIWKQAQGIADSDPLIRTNYGFIGTQAVQIDVGPLRKEQISQEAFTKELHRITASLKCFLELRAPSLVPVLDQELEKSVSSSL